MTGRCRLPLLLLMLAGVPVAGQEVPDEVRERSHARIQGLPGQDLERLLAQRLLQARKLADMQKLLKDVVRDPDVVSAYIGK